MTADNVAFPNFTADENAGKALFISPPRPPRPGHPGAGAGAGCAACHRPPEFDIAPDSGNNGVIGSLGGGTDFTNTRSPSLRDLIGPSGGSHGGFMHDASLATLGDVIDHYDSIDGVNPGLDGRLAGGGGGQQLNLTATQKAQLVAFLKTLTGSSVYEDTKFSNPFDENDQISLVVLPLQGGDLQFSGSGEDRQVTVTSNGVPNVDYILQSSTNLKDWTGIPVQADSAGILTAIAAAPLSVPKQFFRITYRSPTLLGRGN